MRFYVLTLRHTGGIGVQHGTLSSETVRLDSSLFRIRSGNLFGHDFVVRLAQGIRTCVRLPSPAPERMIGEQFITILQIIATRTIET